MKEDYTTQIQESVDMVFRALDRRVSGDDMRRVREAYELAYEAHKEQRRKSGEPYIIHPIAVAHIVAEELELGANPVIAAFLHDVVEDTSYTIENIRDKFGEDVAFLVGVVTKKKKEKYQQSKQVDNYRQLLAAVEFDIRAMLIKLADRLHNMRTLESMRPDKQMKIAGETDYFYAPLANRIGLYHVKSELENLSFRFRCPREYAVIDTLLEEEKAMYKESIQMFTTRIGELLRKHEITSRLEVRYRTPYSTWRKMQTAGCDFGHVDGKHYIRIIYSNGDDSEKNISLRIYSILSDNFKERPGSVSNHINAPKENGYQSFHVTLLNHLGKWEEVHISSERMARNSRLGCAAERTENNVNLWLKKFNAVLQDLAQDTHNIDFMEGVTSSFYNDDILVFTPKGKGIILPKDATVLDFAFEIHRDLGIHAEYAHVNGKLCSVKTKLKQGDCVEVGINPQSKPDEDWINHVYTYKAKKGLRGILAERPKIVYHRGPHCHPLPGDEVVGFLANDGTITLHKRNCPDAIRLASQQGDSIVAVTFEEHPDVLYPVRIQIKAIDRYHLLSDLIDCITEKLHLSMTRLFTETKDRIAECTIDFSIHSVKELQQVIDMISTIKGVDEVRRLDIE